MPKRIFQGGVSSDKQEKTAPVSDKQEKTVVAKRRFTHPLLVKRRKKKHYHAYVPDVLPSEGHSSRPTEVPIELLEYFDRKPTTRETVLDKQSIDKVNNKIIGIIDNLPHNTDVRFNKNNLADDVVVLIHSLNKKHELGLSDVDVRTHAEQWAQSLVASKTGEGLPAISETKTEAESGPSSEKLSPPLPRSWEEAKAQVPGLMKWNDAKEANLSLTIVEHLRDEKTGWGAWTLTEPGLPRGVLQELDKPAHKALYNWLAKKDPVTGRCYELPPDIHLPRRSDLIRRDVSATPDDAKEARRIASLLHRMTSGEKASKQR